MGAVSVTPVHISTYLSGLLKYRGITSNQLAKATHLSSGLIAELEAGQQILTADVALSLGEFFEVSPLVFLEVQASYFIVGGTEKK